MYMLRLFAVDWGAFQALGDTSVTASVLTQFWGVHRHLLSTDPSYVDKTHALDDRMKAYTLTVRAQTPNVFASVGKAFAIACGHANDPLYFLPGTIAFRDTVILVSKVLYDAGLSTTVLSPS
jgi:hypothetical protein